MISILYKPNFMIPSAANASGGIIDVTKPQVFTAQLHASSGIDAYQVLIRENTADNTIVYSSGIQVLDDEFKPTDEFGNPIPFEINIPASQASLQITDVVLSDDYTIVYLYTNVAIRTNPDYVGSGISLSTNGGVSWGGASSNPITNISVRNNAICITFTSPLTGKSNKIKVPAGYILPIDSYYETPDVDMVSDQFDGFLTDSLVSLNLSSNKVAIGTSFTATVTGNKNDYSLSRNGQIDIQASGSASIASRTQADNRISYNIMGNTIFFYVGASVPTGTYTVKYTDSTCTGSPNYVQATLQIVASNQIVYTESEVDDDRYVLSMTMNQAVSAKSSLDNLISKILLSNDDGSTWTGTSSNPVVAVGFTDAEATATKPAYHNLHIEFKFPLSRRSCVRIPSGSITNGQVDNTEMTTPVLVGNEVVSDDNTDETIDTFLPVDNTCVNGYQNGYKWTLRLWSGIDTNEPLYGMVESYEACFNAESTPIVEVDGESYITRRYASWNGSYYQQQGVPCLWYRWTLSTDDEVVKDTGMIYSSVTPSFSYSGLLSGHTYTIKLTCMNQSGIEQSSEFESTVEYAAFGVPGTVKASTRSDGSIEVRCEQADYIQGVVTGNAMYLDNVPVDGHTSIRIGEGSSVTFSSTPHFGVDFTETDTLIARIHSMYDGVLLSYQSEDGLFSCQLIHEGLTRGLIPRNDLFPEDSLYPLGDNFGHFRYVVNGEDVAIIDTPYYGFMWYTVLLTHDAFTLYEERVY